MKRCSLNAVFAKQTIQKIKADVYQTPMYYDELWVTMAISYTAVLIKTKGANKNILNV